MLFRSALVGCVEQVLENDTKEDRIVLAEALIRDGEMELAGQQIDYVVTRYPDYGAARLALGRWYAALGDLERTRIEWLRAGQLGEVDPGLRGPDGHRYELAKVVRYSDLSGWHWLLYRRQHPED